MSLTSGRQVYKPFLYPEAYDYWLKQQQSHWLHTEIPMSSDIQNWKLDLTETEKNVVGGILKGFTQTELLVNDYWTSKISKWFPHPEISMMATTFGAFETIHAVAYANLNDSLGIDDYDAFLHEPTAKAKIDRLVGVGNYFGPLTLDDFQWNKAIAKSLAVFSAFTEGVNLFSSFAVLLNFSRFNKLKGVGQIISWSIRDECFGEGTEILTNEGWKDLSQISLDDKVAQFDTNNNLITFVNPERIIEQDYDGDMVQFSGQKLAFNALTTPNHDFIQKIKYNDKWNKIKADDMILHSNYHIPVGGYGIGEKMKLSPIERFRVVTQADGSISDRYTGERCGTIPIFFSFSKQRKIDRFIEIIKDCKFSYKEEERKETGNRKKQKRFIVNVPIEYCIDKSFDWIDLQSISSMWVSDFVEELSYWDGNIPSGKNSGKYIYYSSIDENNVNKVQAVCSLGGLWATKSKEEDDRKDTFSTIYRLYIHKMDKKTLGSTKKEIVQYKGKVRCVSVPSGAIVLRYKDSVFIAGNCLHSEAGCWLFRQLIKENPEIWTDELKKEIYEAARLTVKLEDDFIDKVFEAGEIEGLEVRDLKNFIRNRANIKLGEIGLKMNWKNIDQESLERMSWFDFLSRGTEHQDFFANRVSEYSKGNVDFDDIF